MNQKTLTFLLLAALVVWLGLNSFFVVDASQRAAIERFGQVQPATFGAGIHAKLPLLDHVIKLDKRDQVASLPALTLTQAQGEVQLNAYVVWQITDASRYVAAAKGRRNAEAMRQSVQAQLGDVINAKLQTQLTGQDMTALVSGDHQAALTEVQQALNPSLGKSLGVSIRQLGLLNVAWAKDQLDEVRSRMQAKAAEEADKHLASGRDQAAQLKAEADAKTTTLLADAYRQAQEIRAEGDAKSGAIYAAAYGKNPDFYRFWRSLQAYRNSFDSKRDVLVLGPDSDFLRYLRKAGDK